MTGLVRKPHPHSQDKCRWGALPSLGWTQYPSSFIKGHLGHMQDTAGMHPSMAGFCSPSTPKLTTPSPAANLKQSRTKPGLGSEPRTAELLSVNNASGWQRASLGSGLGMNALQGAQGELRLTSQPLPGTQAPESWSRDSPTARRCYGGCNGE